jgi:hypothetical protein
MICKQCGTEIADKALVCYRCGRATAEPAATVPTVPARRSRIPAAAALLVMVLGALFMAQAAAGEAPRIVLWSVAVLATFVLIWWVWRGRK